MSIPLSQELRGIILSSPKRFVSVDGWPVANQTATARFGVLVDDRGQERTIRWITGKPKLIPHWSDHQRIVTGSNDRHYIVTYSGDTREKPVDNQGRYCKLKGRAAIYRADMKPECLLSFDGGTDLWFRIRELCLQERK